MTTILQQQILDMVVKPSLKERLHAMKGVIVEYNNEHNFASVELPNPEGGGGTTLIQGVPVQIGSGGVHSAGPFPGDEVWISFLGGSIYYPRITALADESYKSSTRQARMKHMRKGVLVPDSIITSNWEGDE